MADGGIPLGVIIERKDAHNQWQDNIWSVVDVQLGASPIEDWVKLKDGDGWEHYHAATLMLELFKGETEGYRYNLSQDPPQVYVVLQQDDEAGDKEVIPSLVTVCPYEAMGYAESGDEIVDGAVMPAPLISWVQGFIDDFHVDEPFKKRKNKRHDPNETRRGPRPGLEH